MQSGISPAAGIDSRVVVSCAGSGKTTQLIDRLMSLLLAGANPGEILAVTFTKKAAAEIRARLLAKLDEEARADSRAAAARRRILLGAAPEDSLSVHTFHGWFLTLLRHRPGGFFAHPGICGDAAAMFDESWRRWQKRAEEAPSDSLRTVLRELSPAALRNMCGQFMRHRAAHQTCAEKNPSALLDCGDDGGGEERADVLRRAAAEFAAFAGGGGKTVAAARAAAARLASGEAGAAEECGRFLTKQDCILSALQKQAEEDGCAAPLQKLAAAIVDCLTAEDQRRADEFNAAALQICAEFARERDALLRARNEMTFDDVELRARKMLDDDGASAELSHRLSTRYRHILIDEFQDTSPPQWRIVRRWLLDAHGEDAPSVFIVGDPKQAIYGFRGGDSRLLGEAESFLREYYGAKEQPPQDICRRCGGNILKFVNEVFAAEMLPGFRPHRGGGGPGGRVEWLAYPPAPKASRSECVRDPLRHPPPAAAEMQKMRAEIVAAKVAEILREWKIKLRGEERRCRPADVLILTPQLTHAAALTDALSAENIACAAAGGGESFLNSFECADILDLVAFLLSPERDYSLARILRSPLFALSDDELAEVAAGAGATLWEKLRGNSAAYSRRARTLLEFWRRRAETSLLPAHDFLSKLFAQGDVFSRYRASAPPPLRFRVGENLSRLLDLSLQIAGGARPLLSQFLDEARRADLQRARAEADSAPSAVRLMSVHAAKGLESPIVVLTDDDLSRTGGRGDGADVFVDWPSSAAAPERFVVSLRRRRRAYAALKQKAKDAEERELVNLFYVAATRAQQALVIFSSNKSAGAAAQARAAMRRLSSAPDDAMQIVFGESFAAAAELSPASPPPSAAKKQAVGAHEPTTAAATRGDMRHRIVALLLSGISPDAARRLVAAEDEQRREAEIIAHSPPLQKLLQNAAEVLVEREFRIGGEMRRPDIVVVREDAVWIADYKTGDASPARHRRQMEDYRRAVAAAYPGLPIRLAVIDIRGEMRVLDDA